MTDREIAEKYLSDVRHARNMFENGAIDRSAFDALIERIDNVFFEDLEMLALITPSAELQKILNYAA